MTKLTIKPIPDKHMWNGNEMNSRIISKFFFELTNKIFMKTQEYVNAYGKGSDFPLANSERNLYSLFSSAIGEITPLHASEWPLSKKNKKGKRVDLWCRSGGNGKTSAKLNFFIEIKADELFLWSSCKGEFRKRYTKDGSKTKLEQLKIQVNELFEVEDLKWDDLDPVFMGILVIPGKLKGKNDIKYDHDYIVNKVDDLNKGSTKFRYLFNTWVLPKESEIGILWKDEELQWGRCPFVTIVGIVNTKKYSG